MLASGWYSLSVITWLLCLYYVLHLQMALILNEPDVPRERLPFYNQKSVCGRPVGLKPGSTGLVAGHALDSATRTPKVGGYPREVSCFPSSLRKIRWRTNFRPLNSKGIFKGQRSTHPIFLTWYSSPLENILNDFQMIWVKPLFLFLSSSGRYPKIYIFK